MESNSSTSAVTTLDTSVSTTEGGPVGKVSLAELAQFARNKVYLKEWTKLHEGKSVFAGFNPWAFLFGIHWFFFRRMYVEGMAVVAFEFVVLLMFFVVAMTASMHGAGWIMSTWTLLGALLLPRICVGIWANIALYKRASKVIREVAGMKLDDEAHLREVANRGRGSIAALLLAHLIFIAILSLLMLTLLGLGFLLSL
ncbi:DUF2628 domain-containing protein [Azoarcus indigens]|nr:DUF2628 domain-containing protein [Azoarcus indigens]NMG67628.1 DUF2628 domain-containing protein [Azoarcus indigens]